ncbi:MULTISPECIES: hypothetical protein [unclassified Kitasatospora]|uniref:hypothetical protein n=1 Tax=unclassified Kitasatospora TaxID=2633591 RepID=UPI0024762537|nr:hypothetical protein [Kitasatospora sp. MAP12-44]
MPISVSVRTFTGETLATCTHPAINALCRRAEALALPMLGYVDPYDDTWFNKSQMRLLVPELKALLDNAPVAEAEAAAEVLALADELEHKPHRYIIFVGD